MTDPVYFTILSRPCALWLACTNEANIPDVVRCSGISLNEAENEITCYLSQAFGASIFKGLSRRPQISLSAVDLYNFESYQYKGLYQSIRPCTEEEVDLQYQYLQAFAALTETMGFSKESFFESYYHQPSYAVTMRVQQVFEQTPKRGTGGKIANLEGQL